MTPDALWSRYSAVWSLPAGAREAELAACLTDEAAYCDPNGLLTGVAALSDYMGRFQASLPGGRFNIRSVLHHHDRSLAQWALHGDQGQVLQTGTSFGLIASDGRFQAISGFFHPQTQAPEP
jgi:hypothetical protein